MQARMTTTVKSKASTALRPGAGCRIFAVPSKRCRQHEVTTSAQSSDEACSTSSGTTSTSPPIAITRRSLLSLPQAALAAAALWTVPAARASFAPPPPGFRLQVDKIDGYSFLYPESWLLVTSSGNDVFFRNPRNIDENVFVDLSSPSSSRYEDVRSLGSPADAAAKILDQYLTREFMSTRIGIRREGKVLSAVERTGSDGRLYYDIAIRMTSYGSLNPYVATRDEVMGSYGVEWDRVLLTTLGVANMRLYELRFQTAAETYDKSKEVAARIADSFAVKEVDATPAAPMPSSLRAF